LLPVLPVGRSAVDQYWHGPQPALSFAFFGLSTGFALCTKLGDASVEPDTPPHRRTVIGLTLTSAETIPLFQLLL